MASVGPSVKARVLGAVLRALRESGEVDPSEVSELSGVAKDVVSELLASGQVGNVAWIRGGSSSWRWRSWRGPADRWRSSRPSAGRPSRN